jgi:hypothetical protein
MKRKLIHRCYNSQSNVRYHCSYFFMRRCNIPGSLPVQSIEANLITYFRHNGAKKEEKAKDQLELNAQSCKKKEVNRFREVRKER